MEGATEGQAARRKYKTTDSVQPTGTASKMNGAEGPRRPIRRTRMWNALALALWRYQRLPNFQYLPAALSATLLVQGEQKRNLGLARSAGATAAHLLHLSQ